MKIKVGVIGATGYTGEEIVKILARHKHVEITSLSAIIDKPTKFSDLCKECEGSVDVICKEPDVNEVINLTEVVFLALPHKVSMQFAPKFLKAGKKVIDLSADYRLDDKTYEKWYKKEHLDKENIEKAVYGLPELNRKEIKTAQLIANPGCYPTSTILGVAPIIKALKPDGIILVDAKSGVSGAGRESAVAVNFAKGERDSRAYKIGGHQHQPEMIKILNKVAGRDIKLMFTPHIIPALRGILSTIYIPLKGKLNEDEILGQYKEFYKNEPFLRVCDKDKLPALKNVVNTNFCELGLKVNDGLLVVVSCIDNLLKGAAGQAVQNMNIMCGFKETEGFIN